MTVWKYGLLLADYQTVRMPEGARILCTGEQGGVPHIWALVDEAAPLEGRLFSVIGTGHIVPPRATYHGSVFCSPFVWHIFEMELSA